MKIKTQVFTIWGFGGWAERSFNARRQNRQKKFLAFKKREKYDDLFSCSCVTSHMTIFVGTWTFVEQLLSNRGKKVKVTETHILYEF